MHERASKSHNFYKRQSSIQSLFRGAHVLLPLKIVVLGYDLLIFKGG